MYRRHYADDTTVMCSFVHELSSSLSQSSLPFRLSTMFQDCRRALPLPALTTTRSKRSTATSTLRPWPDSNQIWPLRRIVKCCRMHRPEAALLLIHASWPSTWSLPAAPCIWAASAMLIPERRSGTLSILRAKSHVADDVITILRKY